MGIEFPADTADSITVPTIQQIREARDLKDAERMKGYVEALAAFYNFTFDCYMVTKGEGTQQKQG